MRSFGWPVGSGIYANPTRSTRPCVARSWTSMRRGLSQAGRRDQSDRSCGGRRTGWPSMSRNEKGVYSWCQALREAWIVDGRYHGGPRDHRVDACHAERLRPRLLRTPRHAHDQHLGLRL